MNGSHTHTSYKTKIYSHFVCSVIFVKLTTVEHPTQYTQPIHIVREREEETKSRTHTHTQQQRETYTSIEVCVRVQTDSMRCIHRERKTYKCKHHKTRRERTNERDKSKRRTKKGIMMAVQLSLWMDVYIQCVYYIDIVLGENRSIQSKHSLFGWKWKHIDIKNTKCLSTPHFLSIRGIFVRFHSICRKSPEN